MRIQHNIAALNSYRQLSGNNNAVAKNLEKLSSGYRINRAGDDAAGLAISEKMRAQIKGLETAQKNANDGISLVQTAEGALTEVHSMLNRMVELATQSANGTYDDSVDRNNLQKELDSLLDEVDRISDATNFNGINLLDGSLGGPKITTTAAKAAGTPNAPTVQKAELTVSNIQNNSAGSTPTFDIDFSGVSVAEGANSTGGKITFTLGTGAPVEIDVAGLNTDNDLAAKFKDKEFTIGGVKFKGGDANGSKVTFTAQAQGEVTGLTDTTKATIGTVAGTSTVTAENAKAEFNFDGRTGKDVLGSTITIGGSKYTFVEDANATVPQGSKAVTITSTDNAEVLAQKLVDAANDGAGDANFTVVATNGNNKSVTFTSKNAVDTTVTAKIENAGLTLQVGDTDDDFQKVRVAVGNMSTEGLGLDTLKSVGIKDQITAGKSIDKIKTAINTVSSTRGDLGAIQNRLEHTINNLGVTTENMTAAESRIRDTDMAEEMMAYTKNNILVQAAQAMLAQANQVPQGVLQLLQ